MPSSIDVSRLNGLQAGIAEGNRGADAIAGGIAGIGNSAAGGIKGALGNRANLAAAEGEKKARLEDNLATYYRMRTQYAVAGQPTDRIDAQIQRLEAELQKMGTVDLSKPTPSWGMDRKPAMNAGNAGALDT